MKRKMKTKRFLSILLSMMMVFSLFTGTVFAEEVSVPESEAVVQEIQDENTAEPATDEMDVADEMDATDEDGTPDETEQPTEDDENIEGDLSYQGDAPIEEEESGNEEDENVNVEVDAASGDEAELPEQDEPEKNAGDETALPEEEETHDNVQENVAENAETEVQAEQAEEGTDILDERVDSAVDAQSETDGDVIEISGQAELKGMADENSYILTADIELTEDWESKDFAGTLDGNGYTITLNGKALFGNLGSGGIVKNLILTGSVQRNADVGAVANTVSGEIRNCVVTADIKCTSAWSGMGGFAGYIQGSGAKITNCIFAGTLEGAGGSFGAVVGERYAGSIERCYWKNTDRAASTWSGGIETSGITDCGEISADLSEQEEIMNANLQEGDLSWQAVNGEVPVPVREKLPDDDEQGIKSADELALIAGAEEGYSYKLAADIELPDTWTADQTFNGILDGNGHTVTLNGSALFGSIGSSGIVKNLILTGTVQRNADVGAVANTVSGEIRNCVVTANIKCTSAWSGMGGFAGYIQGSGAKITNCIFAGTLEGAGGSFGAVVGERYAGSIERCYWKNTDRAASTWSGGIETSGITDCGEISEDAQEQAAILNANLQDGDLSWKVNDENIPVLVRGSVPDVGGTVNTTALDKKIAEAQGLNKEDGPYTDDSWNALTEALNAAQDVREKEGVTQTEIDSACASLSEAINALEKEEIILREEPVDLTDKEVIEISAADGLKNLEAGKYYRLTADISTGKYWYGITLPANTVLDGGGHVVTLENATLFDSIAPGAVVQNLGVVGTAFPFMNNGAGAIVGQCSGLIANCWARVDVTGSLNNNSNAGGLAADLLSGSAVVNSYATGKVTASRGLAGAIAGTAVKNSLIKNCYYLAGTNLSVVGNGEGRVEETVAKTREDFYDPDFIALLNQGKGAAGLSWGLSSEGYPYHGENQEYEPDPIVEFTFTAYNGETKTFTNREGLTFTTLDADADNYAGTLAHPEVTRWMEPGHDSSNAIINVTYEGELRLYKEGTTEIVGYTEDWAEVGRFMLTVIQGEGVQDLRLCLNGEPVTEVTLEGREKVTLQPQLQLADGSWKTLSKNNFTYSATGDLINADNTIYAAKPGSMSFTASGYGQTASVNVVSTYVPVENIEVAPNGTYKVHERNANSDGMANFLDLNLAFQTGDVIVSPENASYGDQWTLTSSDPDILEYIPSMVRAVLPKKAGTATLTASSADPELSEQVTDSKTITIEYFNPVTSIELNAEEVSVKTNESVELPLTFVGPETENGYRVTEPGMTWKYQSSDGGAVEIGRSAASILPRRQDGYKEYCVANDQYTLTGISAGTVTVIGTPEDQTGGAEPIRFTVVVGQGEAEPEADSYQLALDGIAGAQTYMYGSAAEDTYKFGGEWTIFSLVRSGKTIDQTKLDTYLSSVRETYTDPSDELKKPTTVARVVLTLTALGQNAADFHGIDFVSMLCGNNDISGTSNEAIWALIALDSGAYEVPSGSKWNRGNLITEILKYQNQSNGGFGLYDAQSASIDITAMAVQSLAPYYSSSAAAKTAVDKALEYMKPSNYTCDYGNAESAAQVLIAVTALGMDPADVATGFAKSVSRNLITNLDSYRNPQTGAFRHIANGNDNAMATYQSLLALESYVRFHDKEDSLYNIAGVRPTLPTEPTVPTEPTTPTEPENPSDPEAPSMPEIGSLHTVSKIQYRILSSDKAAVHKLLDKTVKNLTVPATVKINGISFTVTTIGTQSFKNCKKLQTITLGKNITMIGSEAFSGCTALTKVKSAAAITSINKKAFYNCKKLQTIGSKSGTITLGKVKTIGSSAFYGCKAVKKVNASSAALTKIDASAFAKCTALTTFTASSKKLVTIGKQAFYGDKKLASVTLKTEKLKKSKVGTNAFKGIKSTCKFKVPSKKVSSYKSILKARGAGSKIKVTK